MKIKEVIVVEGRDDESAVKKAVDAEVIITHGFGIKKSTMDRIRVARKRCGVIIFTDPDHAGEKIRQRIDKSIAGCKHAFLPLEQAIKDGDIGIENANPTSIRQALSKVHTAVDISEDAQKEFSHSDLIKNELVGGEGAQSRRVRLGAILGIGYGNAKQFLRRLNHYGISREEFSKGIEKVNRENL